MQIFSKKEVWPACCHLRKQSAKQHHCVQTKTANTRASDRYEAEADRIASQIVAAQGSNHTVNRFSINRIDHPSDIHPNHRHNTTFPVHVAPRMLQSSTGKPLGNELKTFFETRLKVNFDTVRIHTDATADKTARSLNARAFTMNNHIGFAAGHFKPYMDSGRKLLAHELVHVLQQGHGERVPGKTSGILQNATLNPQIGRRRARVINGALGRVPDVVRSALYVLGRFLSGTENDREYMAVVMAFGASKAALGWEALILPVISTYSAILMLLQSPRCLILYDPNLDSWGRFSTTPQGGFTWEILVGRRFYIERISQARRRWLGRFADRASTNLLRTLTLMHEAVHSIHGAGHSSQSLMCNPYMYEQLILEIRYGPDVGQRFDVDVIDRP